MSAIGYSAFYDNQLTSVSIPSSVTSIGWEAFRGNKLTEVILPEALYRNKGNAFNSNSSDLKFYAYDATQPGNKGGYLGGN